ncbi:hypothetical protein ACX5CW_004136 [Enterobacter ludwigii]
MFIAVHPASNAVRDIQTRQNPYRYRDGTPDGSGKYMLFSCIRQVVLASTLQVGSWSRLISLLELNMRLNQDCRNAR